MTLDPSMLSLMEDSVTIEPYTGQDSEQASTYGTAVTYPAQIEPWVERVIMASGREVRSAYVIIIPDRLTIDSRSRLTMPAGWEPQSPPILAVRPLKGLSLDHTTLLT